MEFVTLRCRSAKITVKDTFDIGVQCVQCSAKKLTLHLAEFSPSVVGRSLEFVVVKKFGKELGNDDHHNKLLQNCLAVSQLFGRETSFSGIKLNAFHRKFDGYFVLVL